jgi:hypothetical protein
VGYSESWRREVLRQRPDQFRLPAMKVDSLGAPLPY